MGVNLHPRPLSFKEIFKEDIVYGPYIPLHIQRPQKVCGYPVNEVFALIDNHPGAIDAVMYGIKGWTPVVLGRTNIPETRA